MISNLKQFEKEKKDYKIIVTSSFNKETVVKINGYKICEYDQSFLDMNEYNHYQHIAIYRVDDKSIPKWGTPTGSTQPIFLINVIDNSGKFHLGWYNECEMFENFVGDLVENVNHTEYEKSLVLSICADYLSYEHDKIEGSDDCGTKVSPIFRNEIDYSQLFDKPKSDLDINCLQ